MSGKSRRRGQPLELAPEGWGDEPRMHLDPAVIIWLHEEVAARAGHHGENAYKCATCDRLTVTVDIHPGVTPMFLSCRRTPFCKGTAVSSCYPRPPRPEGTPEPAWEWYRPSRVELRNLTAETRGHVMRGGLVLRERTDVPADAYKPLRVVSA